MRQDESSIDFTQGNLRAALQKRCMFDQKLASIVSTCSRIATFLSPEVQNTMICCAATVLLRDVTAPVHDAGPFSVIGDGTSDISRCEHLSVTLRYENEGKRAFRFSAPTVWKSLPPVIYPDPQGGGVITPPVCQILT